MNLHLPGLQFVNEEPQKDVQDAPAPGDATSMSEANSDTRSGQAIDEAILPQSDNLTAQQDSPEFEYDGRYGDNDTSVTAWDPDVPQERQRNYQADAAFQQAGMVLGDRYEFAVRGLLALGTGNGASLIAPSNIPNSSNLNQTAQRHSVPVSGDGIASLEALEHQHQKNNVDVRREPNMSLSSIRASSIRASNISQERMLELMRHYRYEVAPWVGIASMSEAHPMADSSTAGYM